MQARCSDGIRGVCRLVTTNTETQKPETRVNPGMKAEEQGAMLLEWRVRSRPGTRTKDLERVQRIWGDRSQVLVELSEGWHPLRWWPGPVTQPQPDLKDNLPQCCRREGGRIGGFYHASTQLQDGSGLGEVNIFPCFSPSSPFLL